MPIHSLSEKDFQIGLTMPGAISAGAITRALASVALFRSRHKAAGGRQGRFHLSLFLPGGVSDLANGAPWDRIGM